MSILYKKYCDEYKGSNKEWNKEFFEYFKKNYFQTVDSWNVSDFQNRTNNFCESLNNDLKNFFKRQHFRGYRNDYTIYGRMLCMYIEERKKLDSSDSSRTRQQKYILKDRIIERINTLQDKIDTEQLMEMISVINSNKYHKYMKYRIFNLLENSNSFNKEVVQVLFDIISYYLELEREVKPEERRMEESEEDIYLSIEEEMPLSNDEEDDDDSDDEE